MKYDAVWDLFSSNHEEKRPEAGESLGMWKLAVSWSLLKQGEEDEEEKPQGSGL